MNKKLYLMSELLLRSFCDSSRDLRKMAVGMSAEDVKLNTDLILDSAEVNEIPKDGIVKLNIDSDGIAHIPVTGMLTRTHVSTSMAFETEAVTTYNFIIESSRLVDENPKVEQAVFEFNTGGGDVDGSEAAALAIANIKKPTTARVHSSAQSAGILLASQTDRIIALGKMSMLGSVGVVAEFIDRSDQDKAEGKKRVILTSNDAPEKRVDITTDKGQKSVIKLMDEIHLAMAGMIARGRNVSIDFVNKNFGKGGTMTAERALQVGLIDEIESLQMSSHKKKKTSMKVSDDPIIQPKTIEENMSLPESLASILSVNPTAKAEFDQLISDAKSEAIKLERDETKSLYESISPIIKSKEYDEDFSSWGFEVLARERTIQSFNDQVSMYDKFVQKAKSEGIKIDQPDPTPPDEGLDKEGMALAAMQAAAKETAQSIGV